MEPPQSWRLLIIITTNLCIIVVIVLITLLTATGRAPAQNKIESRRETKTAANVRQNSPVFSNELDFFPKLISLLKKSGVALILTETSDLLASTADFDRKLPNASLIRLGVLGEVVDQLERVVDGVKEAACGDKTNKTDEADVKLVKNYEDGLLANVFFILKLDANNTVSAFLEKKRLCPFS